MIRHVFIAWLLLCAFLAAPCAAQEALSLDEMLSAQEALSIDEMEHAQEAEPIGAVPEATAPAAQQPSPSPQATPPQEEDHLFVPAAPREPSGGILQLDARETMIDRILALAEKLYNRADGRAQRAHYAGDIYICKNFTVHLFREVRDDFRMAEYPDVELVIPNNQKSEDCAPYRYGVEWQDVPASEGNPFYAAASFRYNNDLSMEENREIARDFLRQVKRGDYFQMAADYYYGVGAHSMLFTRDYDPATNTVHWADSNMKGKSVGGERYAYVQYDAEKDIDWFVDAFCHKKFGATIYRLREDIVFAE